MRENSNVIDGLTLGIMGKSGTKGQTCDYPCQSIKCMADLATTDSIREGMGTIWLRAKMGNTRWTVWKYVWNVMTWYDGTWNRLLECKGD